MPQDLTPHPRLTALPAVRGDRLCAALQRPRWQGLRARRSRAEGLRGRRGRAARSGAPGGSGARGRGRAGHGLILPHRRRDRSPCAGRRSNGDRCARCRAEGSKAAGAAERGGRAAQRPGKAQELRAAKAPSTPACGAASVPARLPAAGRRGGKRTRGPSGRPRAALRGRGAQACRRWYGHVVEITAADSREPVVLPREAQGLGSVVGGAR